MASNPVPLPPDLAVDVEPFTLDDLDLLADDQAVEAGEGGIVRRWRVENDGTAEWAMRHLAVVEGEHADVEAQAAAWVEQIADWQARRTARLVHRAAFFRAHLEDYALRRREADPKAKSLTLPSGVVRTTLRQEQVIVVNEAAFLRWATAELDAETFTQVVKITESARLTELRKMAGIVDVPERVVLSCGCAVDLDHDPFDPLGVAARWMPGSAVEECPSCQASGTVIRWADTRPVAALQTVSGPAVAAGLDVAPASLSAKATAEAP